MDRDLNLIIHSTACHLRTRCVLIYSSLGPIFSFSFKIIQFTPNQFNTYLLNFPQVSMAIFQALLKLVSLQLVLSKNKWCEGYIGIRIGVNRNRPLVSHWVLKDTEWKPAKDWGPYQHPKSQRAPYRYVRQPPCNLFPGSISTIYGFI